VFVRVTSWIVLFAVEEMIHVHHTNKHERIFTTSVFP